MYDIGYNKVNANIKSLYNNTYFYVESDKGTYGLFISFKNNKTYLCLQESDISNTQWSVKKYISEEKVYILSSKGFFSDIETSMSSLYVRPIVCKELNCTRYFYKFNNGILQYIVLNNTNLCKLSIISKYEFNDIIKRNVKTTSEF